MTFSWLRHHYPFEDTIKEKLNTVLALWVSACLILLLLQPFGFSLASQSLYFLALLLTGTLTFIINFLGFPYFFPRYFNESKWSIAKAIIFLSYNFLIIGLWSHIYQVIFVEQNIFLISNGTQLLTGMVKTLAVGTAASAFFILIRYNILTRRHLQIAQELNMASKAAEVMNSEELDSVKLYLENKEISISRHDLSYVSAEGNYIALKIKGKTQPSLFRATMKQVEDALSEYPEYFRCHRSFIINLNAIASLKGNSQGLQIKVSDHPEQIPVARPKIKQLQNLLRQKVGGIRQFVTN